MNNKEIDALDRILDYMWDDEIKHFKEMYDSRIECEDDNDHIFCSILVLERYLKKPRK